MAAGAEARLAPHRTDAGSETGAAAEQGRDALADPEKTIEKAHAAVRADRLDEAKAPFGKVRTPEVRVGQHLDVSGTLVSPPVRR